ncbi:hypothetical protein V6N12_013044 [Hibiscus sabdariffa]|uniref:Uncharacterized protein n=1 Tax=Hibiscus sabdariffa TaxID=183260 RepID=A0ABR2EG73_9ROSI
MSSERHNMATMSNNNDALNDLASHVATLTREENHANANAANDNSSSLECIFKQFTKKSEANNQRYDVMIQSQLVSLRALENQMRELVVTLSTRKQGSLSSNTEVAKANEKGH